MNALSVSCPYDLKYSIEALNKGFEAELIPHMQLCSQWPKDGIVFYKIQLAEASYTDSFKFKFPSKDNANEVVVDFAKKLSQMKWEAKPASSFTIYCAIVGECVLNIIPNLPPKVSYNFFTLEHKAKIGDVSIIGPCGGEECYFFPVRECIKEMFSVDLDENFDTAAKQ